MGVRQRTFDTLLDMWSTGATISPGTNVPGKDDAAAALSYDTGGGFTEGYLVVDVASCAVAVAASGKSFKLELQGSNVSTFATTVPLALMEFGDAYAIKATGAQVTAGRYIAPFNNDWGGTVYRYLRMYCTTGGTSVTGIQFLAFLSKIQN
jgi:hypothetical protein